MVTVFFGINGAVFINWPPPGEKFDSGYFYEEILDPLSETLHNRRAARSARPIRHFDNAVADDKAHGVAVPMTTFP
jgi:hypothetical protein